LAQPEGTEISKGEWIAPELGEQKFREYATQWMRDRVLKSRTVELYDGLLANHLYPTFGDLSMSDIDEAAVRRWRKERLEAGAKANRPFGPVTVAKAYRLLHAIFETAAEDDRIIPRNPCHIDGAGKEESDERQIVPLPVVFEIAKAVPVRYRALVLLATFADMRWGELVGLRRENIDLEACEIRITEHSPNSTRAGCALTRQSRAPVSALSRSPPRSPQRSAGISTGSPNRGSGASSSSGQRAASYAARTSTSRSGTRRGKRWACPIFTFTTCDTLAAPCRRPRARRSKS